jgi:hypothetical protein
MARTPEGKLLTELHRKQQLALRARVVRDVMRIFPAWRPSDPKSYEAFAEAMVLMVKSRSTESAALAARYFELFRAVETGTGISKAVALAPQPAAEHILASLSATSRGAVYKALAAGQPYEQAMANGLVQVSGSMSRLVSNTGRDTILAAVKHDGKAQGWARATGGNPCAFCAMLASRGPVYKEETVDFQAHDHCTCHAEPVYPGSEWPGDARAYRDLWDQSGSLKTFRSNLAAQRTAATEAAATAAT